MHPSRERRAAERKWIYRDALLSIPHLRSVYSCGMRDLSDRGVGLRLDGLPLLPTEFNLSLDGFRTTLGCRLIWRVDDFAGIAFRPTAIGQAQL
jgi:PilZ domain